MCVCGPDLNFEQPAAVRLEVTVVNLAHRVHVLVSDLLGNRPLIGQKELIEKSAETKQRDRVIGFDFTTQTMYGCGQTDTHTSHNMC